MTSVNTGTAGYCASHSTRGLLLEGSQVTDVTLCYARTLCSTLTHSKRELNSLYNKISEHSWTDQLILCRSCAVSTQGKRSEPEASPLRCPALIIHTEIRNPKLDLKMWLTCWLGMVLRPTVSTVLEWLQKDITKPKDTDSYLSKVSVGIFKERS